MAKRNISGYQKDTKSGSIKRLAFIGGIWLCFLLNMIFIKSPIWLILAITAGCAIVALLNVKPAELRENVRNYGFISGIFGSANRRNRRRRKR